MKRPDSFSDQIRRDVEKRLRAAIHKLTDRATDAAIANERSYRTTTEEHGALWEEEYALDRHIAALRRAVAQVVVDGRIELRPDAEEALQVAQDPRRPARTARETPKPAPAPEKPKAEKPKPTAPKAPAPPRASASPRTYTVTLPVDVPTRATRARAGKPLTPTAPPLALEDSRQQRLFGQPLMLAERNPRPEDR
jgi:hypothetical protein